VGADLPSHHFSHDLWHLDHPRGQPNVAHYPYAKNWFYVVQRISGMVIALFLLFHVLGMKGLLARSLEFDPTRATATTVHHLKANWLVTWFVYPVGILASCYHLANGFWTAAITWGLTISAASQKRWGVVCSGIFAFTLACGFLAWFAVLRH